MTEYKPSGTDMPVRVAADIQAGEAPPRLQWHSLERVTVLDKVHTQLSSGLTGEDAAARLARFAPDALPQPRPRSALGTFMDQLRSLPVMLLGAAAGVSAISGGLLDAAAILGVVVLNAAIGFATERQSEKTIRALTTVQFDPALVLRDRRRCEIPVEEIVVGDVLILTPGQYVCADARLIKTKRLLMRGHSALQMFKSAVSLAVAALPEGLPTVATTTLALGMREMRTHQVLIRKLDAAEALGAMQVLCLDKTGTLTMNRMSVTAV